MVVNATSLTSNGLRDWLIQRFSSIILALYTFFLAGYFLLNSHVDFISWQMLFAHHAMKIFTILALISLVLHAYIGLWTILTDYVKVTSLRIFLEFLVIFVLIIYFIWGSVMLWSF